MKTIQRMEKRMSVQAKVETMYKEKELKKQELALSLECERKACGVKNPKEQECWLKKAREYSL